MEIFKYNVSTYKTLSIHKITEQKAKCNQQVYCI